MWDVGIGRVPFTSSVHSPLRPSVVVPRGTGGETLSLSPDTFPNVPPLHKTPQK